MKYVISTLLCLAIISPQFALARHSSRVDTSDLGKDIVEEIPAPVLFGIDIKTLVPDFGEPRGGGTRTHVGQDMLAPKGTPIVSPTEAVVTSKGTGPSAGKYVYTANPGGESFRYMHLDSIADIDVGDELSVGDLIGTVGDTGNAPDGVYHLHFEIKDKSGDFVDPYTRLKDEFTVKEKMSFLRDILRKVDEDEDDYAEFLVTEFPTEFKAAFDKKYSLPDEIEDAMKDSVFFEQGEALHDIKKLLAVVPQILVEPMYFGEQGPKVQLLQLYVMFYSQGSARDALFASGATGYYGPVTQSAIREYQENMNLEGTGQYNVQTRVQMSK